MKGTSKKVFYVLPAALVGENCNLNPPFDFLSCDKVQRSKGNMQVKIQPRVCPTDSGIATSRQKVCCKFNFYTPLKVRRVCSVARSLEDLRTAFLRHLETRFFEAFSNCVCQHIQLSSLQPKHTLGGTAFGALCNGGRRQIKC